MKKLAEEVAKDAKAEAKQIVAQAKEEASSIMAKAQAEADAIRAGASAKAEKEAKQVSREVVASANQAMQKDILIAKKEALDATLANAKGILADAGWKKRSSLLKALMAQADEMSDSSFTVHPVEVDKAAVKKLGWKSAVGKQFNEGNVIGVVEDFHLQTFDLSIEPLFMKIRNEPWSKSYGQVILKISLDDYDGTKTISKESY